MVTWIHITLTVAFEYLIFVSSKSTKQLRPGSEKMLFIGIFENCPTSKQHEQQALTDSMLCERAIYEVDSSKNEFWDFAIERGEYDLENITSSADFEYQTHTFCTHQEATEIAINIKLNESFMVSNATKAQPKWNKKLVDNWSKSSRIVFVIIHSSREEVSDFYREVFLGENFVVFILDNKYTLPLSYVGGNVHAATDSLKHNSEKLLYLIDSATWTNKENYHAKYPLNYFGVIYIESDYVLYKLEFEYLYENYLMKHYRELQKCFFVYRLDMTNESIETLIHKLNADNDLHFLVFIGNPFDQVKFMWRMYNRIRNKFIQWVLYDVDETFNPTFEGMAADEWTIYTFNSYNLKFYIDYSVEMDSFEVDQKLTLDQISLVETCKDAFEDQMIRIMQLIHLYNKFDHFKYFTFRQFKDSNVRRMGKRGSRNRIFAVITNLGFKNFKGVTRNNYIMKYKNLHDRNKCPEPNCGVGKYRDFGKITTPSRLWNESYGWLCRQCPMNHYRSNRSFDNATCLPCLHRTLSNDDQSGCYDPFIKIFLRFGNKIEEIIAIAVCCTGSLFSITVIVIFIILRKTPFVKAADLPSTVLHLILMSLIFITFPILFVGEPTQLKCTLQPIGVLLLCTCPTTIILMKSQKILVAFKTKTRLSTGQKRKSIVLQYTFVGTIILIDSAILLLTIMISYPKVIMHFDLEKYETILTCNTGYHLNTQVAILILQHLFATLQAYRGRNLPGPFNEAMSIVYSTFIVIMTYIVIFPIYYMQQDVLMKASLHYLIIPMASGLFILIFYGQKLFVILCKPHKNTRTYFQQKMMEDAQENVVRKMRGGGRKL